MCGIYGYVGKDGAIKNVLNGLSKIEYRGYDSAGVTTLGSNNNFETFKTIGGVDKLQKLTREINKSNIAIGHTRWATHGIPSIANAHPHVGEHFALVHNGIIENYETIKQVLISEGCTDFKSQTDSEVLMQLIERNYRRTNNVRSAITNSLKAVKGTFGLAISFIDNPQTLYLARRSSPIVIGLADDGLYVSSDVSALAGIVKNVTFLDDDQLAVAGPDNFEIYDLDHNKQDKTFEKFDQESQINDKGGYRHFMLKEIMEQPESAKNTLRGRLDLTNNTSVIGGLELNPKSAKQIEHIVGVGCGTAYNSILLSSYLIEQITDIHLEPKIASEFLYRKQYYKAEKVFGVAVSQSGETADTIAATNKLNLMGIKTHGIVNATGSNLPRITDSGSYLYCGPEIAVASTKAFTSQVIAQLLLALKLNELRGHTIKNNDKVITALKELPNNLELAIKTSRKPAQELAAFATTYDHVMFLGRGSMYPVAMEGALKYKEITYTQSEAYPAGEMKHGPLALVDDKMLIVYLIAKDHLFDKNISNIKEIEARNGNLLVVTDSETIARQHPNTLLLPQLDFIASPLAFTIALQFLSYYVALNKKISIDKPRNLAKSVTVE